MSSIRRVSFGLALAALAVASSAQTLPVPQNVVSLAAAASLQVPQDWLTVVLATTREGSAAASLPSRVVARPAAPPAARRRRIWRCRPAAFR